MELSPVGDGPWCPDCCPVRLVWRWRGSALRRAGVHCASSSPQLARAGGPGQSSQHSAAPASSDFNASSEDSYWWHSDGDHQPGPALGHGRLLEWGLQTPAAADPAEPAAPAEPAVPATMSCMETEAAAASAADVNFQDVSVAK